MAASTMSSVAITCVSLRARGTSRNLDSQHLFVPREARPVRLANTNGASVRVTAVSSPPWPPAGTGMGMRKDMGEPKGWDELARKGKGGNNKVHALDKLIESLVELCASTEEAVARLTQAIDADSPRACARAIEAAELLQKKAVSQDGLPFEPPELAAEQGRNDVGRRKLIVAAEMKRDELVDAMEYTDMLVAIIPFYKHVNPATHTPDNIYSRVLQEIRARKDQGMQPKMALYNALMLAVSKVNLEKAVEVYEHVMAADGVPPNKTTYRIFNNSHSKSGNLNALRQGKSRAKKVGCEANITFYHSLLKRCGLAAPSNPKRAWGVVGPFGDPDATTYNLLVQANMLTEDYEGALRAYQLMQIHKLNYRLHPDYCNPLIYVAALGAPPACAMAYALYNKLVDRSPVPDMETYRAMLAVCWRDGEAMRARLLKAEMEENGMELDAAVYNAVIGALGKAGKWEAAVGTFREMQAKAQGRREHPLATTEENLSVLIDACFGPEGAEGRLRSMVEGNKRLSLTSALDAALSFFCSWEAHLRGHYQLTTLQYTYEFDVSGSTHAVAAAALLSALFRITLGASAVTSAELYGLIEKGSAIVETVVGKGLVVVTHTLETPDDEELSRLQSSPTELCLSMENMLHVLALGRVVPRRTTRGTQEVLVVEGTTMAHWLRKDASSVFTGFYR